MINLPILAISDEVIETLKAKPCLVLVAPPGAGKTTHLPLLLKDHVKGKIIIVEPRRLAARSAAARMASSLNEGVGETIGLRVRFETRVSAKTRIELVTEGVYTRMIRSDPELKGYDLVIFDEFHERSLEADFALALTLETQMALRDDLKILTMSATLDGARVSKLMHDAPILHSSGRSFPVENRYVGRDKALTLEEQMAVLITRIIGEEKGSILAFLPGMGEIKRLVEKLEIRIKNPLVDIIPLFGALSPQEQSRAIEKPLGGRRKIVIATAIAETSITIDGVRVVVDSGYSRLPRYEPDLAMTRLVTERSPKAVNEQRRGRAGRVEEGICYRLWEEREEGSLPEFNKPEILAADLTSLLLDCADWGTAPSELLWQDSPPQPALNEALTLLTALKALDQGKITALGRAMSQLPLHPRHAKMVIEGERAGFGQTAVKLALLLSERGLGGESVNLGHRYANMRHDQVLKQGLSWVKKKGQDDENQIGGLLLAAYPDRLGKARGKIGHFILANGRGAYLDNDASLMQSPYIIAPEITGSAQNTRIMAACAINESDLYRLLGDELRPVTITEIDSNKSLKSKRVARFGALILKESPLAIEPTLENALVLAEAIIKDIEFTKPQSSLLSRLKMMAEREPDLWPKGELKADDLAPYILGKSSLSQITAEDLGNALQSIIDYQLTKRLDLVLPSHFMAPTGNQFLIDYDGEEPRLAIRVPELYGLKTHPTLGNGKIPLLIELLSPAYKPVQITRDLIGFWQGSYRDVRIEMKGRYPRHPWPEDPMEAMATARAKPRGT